jgi:hypothetical protein
MLLLVAEGRRERGGLRLGWVLVITEPGLVDGQLKGLRRK